ncbi:MAG: hypothetical protein AB1798_19170 [Spirochaetota bacterium]
MLEKGAGVKALILAYQAFKEKGITEIGKLKKFAGEWGQEGLPLAHGL